MSGWKIYYFYTLLLRDEKSYIERLLDINKLKKKCNELKPTVHNTRYASWQVCSAFEPHFSLASSVTRVTGRCTRNLPRRLSAGTLANITTKHKENYFYHMKKQIKLIIILLIIIFNTSLIFGQHELNKKNAIIK
jgi:hypothetical protein